MDEAVNQMDSSAEKYSCDDADDDDDIFVTIFYKNQVCNYTLFFIGNFFFDVLSLGFWKNQAT